MKYEELGAMSTGGHRATLLMGQQRRSCCCLIDPKRLVKQPMKSRFLFSLGQDADHAFIDRGDEPQEAATAFILGILAQQARPTMTWEYTNTTTQGQLIMTTSEKPTSVRVILLNHVSLQFGLLSNLGSPSAKVTLAASF